MKDKVISTFQDGSIQAGARKTYPVSLPEAWAYLVSPAGIGIWLGIEKFQLLPGRRFSNGLYQGEIKIVKELSHIRMIWKRTNWPAYSTMQIRVFRADTGTTISFHQGKLSDEAVRNEMSLHWEDILSQVGERFRLSEN